MLAVVHAKVEAEVGVALTNHDALHQPETPVTVPPRSYEEAVHKGCQHQLRVR
jgi:hypothetical protein